MTRAVHLDLDGAWDAARLAMPAISAREWGPRLRFIAPERAIEEFYATIAADLPPFVVFGSGDFHHVTGLLLRNIQERVHVISFDNHPDWDIRPPKWGCGGWVNRALELPHVEHVSVWGCGNFECWWPCQVFGNRRAERAGLLDVHPWCDGRDPAGRTRRGAIASSDWREKWRSYVQSLDVPAVYITIDIDCLQPADAVTNWENGRFSVDDVRWAVELLRTHARLVGADLCGAYSTPAYARWWQWFAAGIDHPRAPDVEPGKAREINHATFARLWEALVS